MDNKRTIYTSMLEAQGAGIEEGLELGVGGIQDMGAKRRPKKLCRKGPELWACGGRFCLDIDFFIRSPSKHSGVF